MNDKLNNNVTILPPFKKFCMTIGELPTSYVISMTYEEQLIWFCNYLEKTVIPAINENGGAVIELQEKYIELKNYVDHYFDSLDVQTEINNKLDDMAEQGELAEIIAQYLETQAIIGFNTCSDLASAENLADGSFARTLGRNTYNDGYGSFYKIRIKTISDVPDGYNIIELTETENLVAERIISEIENPLKTYDTLDDMINDTKLTIGDNVYVLGDKEQNDGFSAYYYITETGSENDKYCIKLDNNLYANLQNEIEDNYYKEIYYKKERQNDTSYWLTFIPFKDENNEQIKLHLRSNEANTTTSDHAIKNNTNVTINGDLSVSTDNINWISGVAIGDGRILSSTDISSIATNETYLGIKADRTIQIYPKNTTAEAMIEDGVENAFLIFGQCATNSVIDANFSFQLENDNDQYIGQKPNKDIVILTIEGRNSHNIGFDYKKASEILIDNGCTNVYALDGGGSTSTCYRGIKLNSYTDNNGTRDREIKFVLDVNKTLVNKPIADIYGNIGKLRYNMNNELRPLINNKETKHLTRRFIISGQTITPNSSLGEKLTAFTGGTPYTSRIVLNNGDFTIDNPDTHISNKPYLVKIEGHLTIHNLTGSDNTIYVRITEDGNNEDLYKSYAPSTGYVDIAIDDIVNSSNDHTYSIYVNSETVGGSIAVEGGKIFITYIPQPTTFIS